MQWADLSLDERELVTKVRRGEIYDGGWRFSLSEPVEVAAPVAPGETEAKLPRPRLRARREPENVEAGAGAAEVAETPWLDAEEAPVCSIAAALIRSLYLGEVQDEDGTAVTLPTFGVQVRGVRLTGELDLADLSYAGGDYLPGLALRDVYLQADLQVRQFRSKYFSLIACVVRGISANNINIQSHLTCENLIFSPNIRSATLNFRGANVGNDVLFNLSSGSNRRVAEHPLFVRIKIELSTIGGDLIFESGYSKILQSETADNLNIDLMFEIAKVGGELKIWGMRTRSIDAYHVSVGSSIWFSNAKCDGIANFQRAQCGNIYIQISEFSTLNLNSAIIKDSAFFGNEFDDCVIIGELRLSSAEICGDLLFNSPNFGKKPADKKQSSGVSLSAYGLRVHGDFRIKPAQGNEPKRPTFYGLAYLDHAIIGRNLVITQAVFEVNSGYAFSANYLKVAGGLHMTGYRGHADLPATLEMNGPINLIRSEIGLLNATGARLDCGQVDTALNMQMSKISSGVFLRVDRENQTADAGSVAPGFTARGCVDFAGATIGALFSADGAAFSAKGAAPPPSASDLPAAAVVPIPQPAAHIALSLRDAVVQGPVSLRHSFFQTGQPQGHACQVEGAIDLRNADIAGDLDCRGAHLVQNAPLPRHPGVEPSDRTAAIIGRGVKVGGSLRLSHDPDVAEPFSSVGRLRLDHARVARDVVITGGRFEHSELTEGGRVVDDVAISLCNAQIGGELIANDDFSGGDSRALWSSIWPSRALEPQRNGVVDLSGAQVRVLRDRGGLGWGARPKTDHALGRLTGVGLRLDGFTYDRLADVQPEADPGFRGRKPSPLLGRLRMLGFLWPSWLFHVLRDLAGLLSEPVEVAIALFDLTVGFILGRPVHRPLHRSRQAWRVRRQWLDLQFIDGRPTASAFAASAFEQLERAFERDGRLEDARRIARRQRAVELRCGLRNPIDQLTAFLYWAFFRFGFSPTWAAITLACYFGLGMMLATELTRQGWLVETHDTARACHSVDPFAFAIDKMLPTLSLNTKEFCSIAPRSTPLHLGLEILGWRPLQVELAPEAAIRTINEMLAIYAAFGALILGLTLLTFSGVLRRNRPTGG